MSFHLKKYLIMMILLSGGYATALFTQQETAKSNKAKPNIIFILADDAGMYELGCYGQKIIKTPHIDKLAQEGMLFINHYSGAPVSAPARCSLLTGKHTGHSAIRDNYEVKPNGQLPLPRKEITVAQLLKKKGYNTMAIGVWGLGYIHESGDPQNQGFDHFYGYLCQRAAHNHYPTFLWEDGKKIKLNNSDFLAQQTFNGNPDDPNDFKKYSGKEYAPDKMTDQVLDFISKDRENPFFLYWSTSLPQVALQVPQESITPYKNLPEEGPYLGYNGYLPHQTPRAAYAAMISKMDKNIGRMMEQLKKRGLDKNTIVFFASDNGPNDKGGTDSKFFKSTAHLRGHKGTLYEGGIRVPLIVRWPGKIKAGSKTELVSAFWDYLPTITDLVEIQAPKGIDGISYLPTLLNQTKQKSHDYLYWEYANRIRVIREGKWKAIEQSPFSLAELYNLEEDPFETTNVAIKNPKLARRLMKKIIKVRTRSEYFPMAGDNIFHPE